MQWPASISRAVSQTRCNPWPKLARFRAAAQRVGAAPHLFAGRRFAAKRALTGEQISAISVHSSLLSRALLELTPTGARDLPVRVSFGQKEYGQGLGDLAAGRAFIETHQACQPRLFWRGVCLFCTSALVKTPSE